MTKEAATKFCSSRIAERLETGPTFSPSHVDGWSSAAPSRKLLERFSNPFSSSPKPSLSQLHIHLKVRPLSSSRCSRGQLPPKYRIADPEMRQLRRIETDASFSSSAAAFPPSPGQPVRPSRRPPVAPFARPASTSRPRPSAGSPAPPVSVTARSTRLLVSWTRSRSLEKGKFVFNWLTARCKTGAVVDG